MINCSDMFIKALKSSVKQLFIKLEIYNSKGEFIKELTRSVTKDDVGSISVDASRAIRRSFSFSLLNINNEFDFGESKLIWLDKKVKLYTGLKLMDGTIEFIPQGVFILTDIQNTNTLEGRNTLISGQDKAYILTDRRGKFINQTTIAVGTNIAGAIKTIASGAGETMFNFDSTITETVPYELTYDSGSSRWDAISELAILAKCDVYYDVYGYLRLRKIDLNEFDVLPSVWSFNNNSNEKFYAGNIRKLDETELANDIVVVGGSGQTAVSNYRLTVDETNTLWTDSPYSIQKLGYVTYFHNNGNPDPLLSSNDECKWRAKYTLMKKLGYSEHVSLQASPIFLFDANDVINIEDDTVSVTGKYLIVSFSIPINPQLMNIECKKYRNILTDWDFI